MYYSSQLLLTTCSFPESMTRFQPIPINLIDTLTTGHIHQKIQTRQQLFHHMPHSMLTHDTQPPHPQPPHKHETWPRAPTLSKTSAAPLTPESFPLPTSSNQLLTSPCLEWNCATSVSAARDTHNRSSTRVVSTTAMFLCTKLWTSEPITRYHTLHSPFRSPGNQKIAKRHPPRSQKPCLCIVTNQWYQSSSM